MYEMFKEINNKTIIKLKEHITYLDFKRTNRTFIFMLNFCLY